MPIVIVACCLAITCTREDTNGTAEWPRTVEPRLTGTRWERCCRPPAAPPVQCADLMINTAADARQMLALHSECVDDAIVALEGRFAPRDASAMSDLAAAYLIRAKQQDRPDDYLRAFDAASHAVASAPDSPAALFNRALAEEALGLTASWGEVIREDHSGWAEEAREHRDRLRRERATDAWTRWTANEAALPAALNAGNRAEVARLIAPFPNAAGRYFESEVQKNPRPAGLAILAEELSRITGERFAVDVMDALGRGAPLEKTPFALVTRIDRARSSQRAAEDLAAIERDARARGYIRIALRALVTHAWALLFAGRLMESLSDYDRAIEGYERLADRDALADTRMRRISVFRALGQDDVAWREALALVRDGRQMTRLYSRLGYLGEVARAAEAIGHPAVGLRYTELNIELSQKYHGPQKATMMAIAYRTRADLRRDLRLFPAAREDLDRADALSKETARPLERQILQAHNAAVNGALLRSQNPARAIAAFTTALEANRQFPTIQASLLAQRAEAHFAVGQHAEAEADLVKALDVLRGEERAMVRPGAKEDDSFWSAYFSRFQWAFQRLIGYLADRNRGEDAFKYAEQARAFEPLSRVMPPEAVDAITRQQIQSALPPGTFLLEYALLDDRAVVWIISHDAFKTVVLNVSRAKVDEWRKAMQDALHAHKWSEFEAALNAPYVALFDAPLSEIRAQAKRLVIVPDGPMHAFPFAALHDPRRRRYLVEDFEISTAGSAKLYFFSMRRDEALPRGNARALLIGDPAVDTRMPLTRGLVPLPHAREEVQAIQSIYSKSADVHVLLGADATIDRFLQLARSSAVIHIAAHGIVNAAKPLHSLIALAPSASDSGVFDAERLFEHPPLDRTKLVVLSSCSSAGGLPIGPEGVAPLVRPLIAAGVPAVVGTLWNVDDATAKELLVSFHRDYEQGTDAAAAMRAAQLAMLRNPNPGLQRPSAWAPFEVIGYSSSPFGAARRK